MFGKTSFAPVLTAFVVGFIGLTDPVEETGDTVEDTAQLSADRHPPLLDAATAAESADNVL